MRLGLCHTVNNSTQGVKNQRKSATITFYH